MNSKGLHLYRKKKAGLCYTQTPQHKTQVQTSSVIVDKHQPKTPMQHNKQAEKLRNKENLPILFFQDFIFFNKIYI